MWLVVWIGECVCGVGMWCVRCWWRGWWRCWVMVLLCWCYCVVVLYVCCVGVLVDMIFISCVWLGVFSFGYVVFRLWIMSVVCLLNWYMLCGCVVGSCSWCCVLGWFVKMIMFVCCEWLGKCCVDVLFFLNFMFGLIDLLL